jgi:hypothetical protein
MHPSEEELEQYAMGRLPASLIPGFEIHLLVRWECQDRLAEADATVQGMREACQAYMSEAANRRPEENRGC